MKNIETFICECNSLEHIYCFWHEEDYDRIYFMPHLNPHRNIFKRIWIAIKYIFGYRSKYGAFDSIIIKREDYNKIKKYMNENI